jgi:predicted RND superfamily exporter protein
MGGLRSMGAIAFLGILLGSVTTLFWFPGLLAFFRRSEEESVRGEVLGVRCEE